jgi:hypothetical protein
LAARLPLEPALFEALIISVFEVFLVFNVALKIRDEPVEPVMSVFVQPCRF